MSSFGVHYKSDIAINLRWADVNRSNSVEIKFSDVFSNSGMRVSELFLLVRKQRSLWMYLVCWRNVMVMDDGRIGFLDFGVCGLRNAHFVTEMLNSSFWTRVGSSSVLRHDSEEILAPHPIEWRKSFSGSFRVLSGSFRVLSVSCRVRIWIFRFSKCIQLHAIAKNVTSLGLAKKVGGVVIMQRCFSIE